MTLAVHAQNVKAAQAPGAKGRDAADASGADSAFADALAQQSDEAAPKGAVRASPDAVAWRSLAVPAGASVKTVGSATTGASATTSTTGAFTPTHFDAGARLARNMAAARLGASAQKTTSGANPTLLRAENVEPLAAAPPRQRATPELAVWAAKAARAAAPSTSTAPAPQSADSDLAASTSKTVTPAALSSAADGAPPTPGDLQLAALLASAPANPQRAPQPAAASASDADPVARIGAALADAGLVGANSSSSSPAKAGAASGPGAKTPVDSPDPDLATEDKPKTFVHVASQQTWLPPVGAGLKPSPAAPTPDHLPGEAKGQPAHQEAAAMVEAQAPTPAPVAAALGGADLARSLPPLATGSGASTSNGTSGTAVAASAAAPNPEPAAPPLTTRRDLEITLEPKELGGLQVRMKSAGDQLQIAFVAERGETARMIADKSGALEGQLHQAGLGLGGVEISTAARPTATGDAPQSYSGSASTGGGAARDDAGASPQRQSASGGPNRDQRQEQRHDTRDKADPASAPGARGLYL